MTKDTLDEKDQLLLQALKANSRASLVALARDIGLSRSATHDRITRLEANGVIKRYTIDVAGSAMPAVQAFLTVSFQANAAPNAVVDDVKTMPGVEAAYCISGDIDLMVYCECATSRELSNIRDTIAARDGVVSIQTRVILAD